MRDELTDRIGFWAAILSTLFLATFAAAFTVTVIRFPEAVHWAGIEAYAANYNEELLLLLMFPVFLLPLSLVTLLACIHRNTPTHKQILSLLALVFTTLYAAQITYNYYTQMTAVRLSILNGELEGLAIHAFFNPHSIALNLELLGYGLLSIGLIFAAFLFHGGRTIARTIFWILLINGVLNALYIFEPFVAIGGPPIVLALFNYTVPIATALIAVEFRKALKESHGGPGRAEMMFETSGRR